jgi:hypothetical protein
MTQVIPAVLLIHYNFNYFNDVFTSGIVWYKKRPACIWLCSV